MKNYLLATLLLAASSHAADITAESCSRDHVNTAISAASDGDTVLVPDGTCAWSSGVSTTKQIVIRAQNFTPTPGGTGARSVTITNNASVPLISMTTGSAYSIGVGGMRFNQGSGTNNHVRIVGTGSKPVLLYDLYFEISNREGNNPDAAFVAINALGGIMYNTYINGIGAAPWPSGASVWIKSSQSWDTNSTMGDRDTQGNINFYVEDCTWVNFGQAPDVDSNGRLVVRYSTFDGVGGLTHGFTSGGVPGRHVEYYNNDLVMTNPDRDERQYRVFWMRGGTGVFTDNYVSQPANGWSGANILDCGDNTTPVGDYPMNRQVGMGYEDGSNVSDPVYLWNNTGPDCCTVTVQGAWASYIQSNRDYFVGTAKPGYTKYTYPHPLREGTPPATRKLNPSGGVRFGGNVRTP